MQGAPERTVTLGGWVQGDYGQDVPAGATIRLETTEGMMGGEQPVNTSGYFEFQGLVKAHYRMTVTAPGFQIYQQDVDLESVGEKLVINVHLSPAPRSKWLPPPASASFTDNNASKKARKEYEKGSRALHDGDMPEAQAHMEKAVKEYPCYVRAQTDLALVLSEKRLFAATEAALKKALDCDADYLNAYNELGQLYYNERKYKESEAILKEGLRRSPMSWQFYYQLGANDFHLGQYRTAEQEYLKAASLSSAVPAEIHVKLADVYLKQYAYDKAYGEMQTYLRDEPEGRFAEKLKGVMRQMESDHVLQANHPADAAPPPPRP
jgi:tetratricopeptide (TPR) repeat protein